VPVIDIAMLLHLLLPGQRACAGDPWSEQQL
jgi:hypothetical protein